MNVSKCKVMVSSNWNDSTEVKIGSSVVEVVEDFCYLGASCQVTAIVIKTVRQGSAKVPVFSED